MATGGTFVDLVCRNGRIGMTVTAPATATEMAVEGSGSETLTTAEESGRKTAAERWSKDRVPGGESRHGFGMSLHEESSGANGKQE